jgi:hypothetical protein
VGLAAETDGAPGSIVGVAIVGMPVARMLADGWTVEVTRLCTDGSRNACSMLYPSSSAPAVSSRSVRARTHDRTPTVHQRTLDTTRRTVTAGVPHALSPGMNNASLVLLADQAIRFAVNGAYDYLRTQGIDARKHVDALLPILREEAGRGAAVGIDDARAAFEANMPQVATATFAATMNLAGIAAAKRFVAQMGT